MASIELPEEFYEWKDIIDEKFWKNELTVSKEEKSAEELQNYVLYKACWYNRRKEVGDILWESFQEDFNGWSENHLKQLKSVARDLMNFLRRRGVYVESSKRPVAKRLFETLQEEKPAEWTEYYIQKQKQTGGFLEPFNPDYAIFQPSTKHIEDKLPISNNSENITSQESSRINAQSEFLNPSTCRESCKNQPNVKQESTQNATLQLNLPTSCSSEILTRLGYLEKYYYDKERRYSGELYDILETKLRIFYELCQKAGIYQENFHMAFSSMLTGRAQDYFFDSLSGKNISFNQMITLMKSKFETHSNRLEYLSRWRNTTLNFVISKNPTKSKEECFEILVEQLRKTHRALMITHQHHNDSTLKEILFIEEDIKLRDQLLSACQSIPECENALNNPKSTFEEVLAQLRNAMYIRTRFNSAFNQYPTESASSNPQNEHDQHWTDRTYNRSKHRGNNGYIHSGRDYKQGNIRSNGYPKNNFRSNLRKSHQNINNKTCWICKKHKCWSTNHSIEEQKEALSKFQKQAFLMETDTTQEAYSDFLFKWEGHPSEQFFEEKDESEDAKINQYLLEINDEKENDDNGASEWSTYVMSITEPRQIIEQLDNQSMLHAITKEDPLENITAYTVETRYSTGVFQGILPDTGASGVSTAGEPQFKALQQLIPSIKLDETRAGEHIIHFGKGSAISLGTTEVPTPFGPVIFHVIPANTPFLLCLKDMDNLDIRLDNLCNVMIQKFSGVKIPVVRKFGHPWIMRPKHQEQNIAWCNLTEGELRQLHRRFGHPSVRRLQKVLERAGHEFDVNMIHKLTKFCRHCQLHGKSPGRFRFNLKKDYDFNHTIIIDIFWIDGKEVLHVIDSSTAFQAARFLKNMSTRSMWEALIICWIDVYLGPPDRIIVDCGRNFNSKEFRQNAASLAIEVETVPVEAHNSIGKIERYHPFLRRAYDIINEEFREKGNSVSPEVILQMAVKAVNDTAGPEGIVPTLLVFGAYPRMTVDSAPSPTMTSRADAIRKASNEIKILQAKRQVSDALGMRNGPDTFPTLNLPINSDVKVWREKGYWDGPFKLLSIKDEECIVQMPYGPSKFRSTAVKPYYRDIDEITTEPQNSNEMSSEEEDFSKYNNNDEEFSPQQENPMEKRRKGRPKGSKNKPKQQIQNELSRVHMGHINQTMAYITTKEKDNLKLALRLREEGVIKTPGKPFESADTKEFEGLKANGVFDIEEYNHNKHANIRIFNSRLVREIKGKGTASPYEKSRLVVQAYDDRGKELILTQSPTLQRASQRLIAVLAPSLMIHSHDISLWVRDITQAYTQATTVLERKIYARLPKELNHLYPPNVVMRILKPLYGIPEAGTHWFMTYFKHHKEALNMTTSTYDPCLLVTNTKKVFEIVGMQTDDTLLLANQDFSIKEEEKLNFSAKPKQKLTTDNPLHFNGCILALNHDKSVDLHQKDQGEKIELIDTNSSNFRQVYIQQRARGAYIASMCQLEAAYDLSIAAQHQEPSMEQVMALNKRLRWQKENIERGLKNVPLNLNTAKLFVFVDGSFANNIDMSSQIGFVLVLANEESSGDFQFKITGNTIHWSSTKSKRVTRSVLASEILGMVAGVDMAHAIATTLKMITQQLDLSEIPIIVCTDSYSLYECLVKLGTTKEKRLMIDIMALRQSYERRELLEIRWINGADNPADAMTKANPNKSLETLIDTNLLTIRVEGWVKRV